MDNNDVAIEGRVETEFELDHEVYSEKFYQFKVSITRESGTKDTIPVIVSEKLIDVTKDKTNEFVHIEGEFRSYNQQTNDGKVHLCLYLFAEQIFNVSEGVSSDINRIALEGFICKPPTYRKTPFGREISDMLIAVNRPRGKCDYIPCIAWGRNARYAQRLEVGSLIRISGRIQSRNYDKNGCTNVAYEVSVIDMNVIE